MPQVLLWLGKDAAWNLLSPTMCLLPACRLTRCFVVTVHNRWLPFALTTVLVGVDFIIMTSRVAGGLVDHVHQVRACSSSGANMMLRALSPVCVSLPVVTFLHLSDCSEHVDSFQYHLGVGRPVPS